MKSIGRMSAGFSLVEMAIVLLIVAMLIGGGLSVVSAQIEQQKFKDTQKLLADARESLLGFAAANGRLPCPATAASNGSEAYVGAIGASACTSAFGGFLPGVTLGMTGLDANGYLVDAWGGPTNRVRYAVTTASGNAATNNAGIKGAGMAAFGAAADLRVCASSTGANPAIPSCGVGVQALTNSAVAVVFSLGPNGPRGAAGGADETANQNNDRIFVWHTPVDAGGTNGEFDDLMTWIPAPLLFNRMLQAGTLP